MEAVKLFAKEYSQLDLLAKIENGLGILRRDILVTPSLYFEKI